MGRAGSEQVVLAPSLGYRERSEDIQILEFSVLKAEQKVVH